MCFYNASASGFRFIISTAYPLYLRDLRDVVRGHHWFEILIVAVGSAEHGLLTPPDRFVGTKAFVTLHYLFEPPRLGQFGYESGRRGR